MKEKKPKLSKLTGTFFRNALRSNLDLTSLADTKAGILISINGFILTVSVTASGFAIHNAVMTYAFVAIILTSLGSIIFAVLAVKPRMKEKLVPKQYLSEYVSLLYYQDMADLAPNDYSKKMNEVLVDTEESTEELITHLHILGTEIKKKYFWLKQAYTYFSLGLIVSAGFMIYALMYVEQTPFYNISKGNVVYTKDKFNNIFEPSGATAMPDGKVLVVEDESSAQSLKLIEMQEKGGFVEIGNLYIPKKIKKIFKKEIEDLEAITSDGNMIYSVTSHTLSKAGKRRKAREKFIMFRYDEGAVTDFYMYSNLKNDLHEKLPKIFEPTLFNTKEINIEGLCYEDVRNTLLLGFRSPLVDGKAMLIGIDNPRDVFLKKEKPKFSSPIYLKLDGQGIRDIVFDSQKNGYWIIAGSATDRDSTFSLWFYNRAKDEIKRVENHPDIGYGEGITIVNKTTDQPGLLIVEDNGLKPNKSADYILINRDSL